MIAKPVKGMLVRLSPEGLGALRSGSNWKNKLGTLTTGTLLSGCCSIPCLRVKWDGIKTPETYSVTFLEEVKNYAPETDYQI